MDKIKLMYIASLYILISSIIQHPLIIYHTLVSDHTQGRVSLRKTLYQMLL